MRFIANIPGRDDATPTWMNPSMITSVVTDHGSQHNASLLQINLADGSTAYSRESATSFLERLASLWNTNTTADTPTVDLNPPPAS